MDSTLLIIVIAIFALVVIAVLIRFRQKATIRFKIPGIKLDASGTNEQQSQPGIRARDITSQHGGTLLDDSTGKGIDAERIQAEGDVLISSSKQKNIKAPKV